MSSKGVQYKFRAPISAPEERGGKPPHYRREKRDGMIIEWDLAVPLRDGVKIYIDLFRPADETTPVPPIIGWGPYGKHGHTRYTDTFPNWGGDQSKLSPYTAFEAPDPVAWVAKGFAIINPDPRGTWYSEGNATFLSPEEAQDYHDLIEWAGTQPWSNGKVGLTGVSYLASSQWAVAATNPPHLAAINPWEGWSDSYREVVRHGGIPETFFWGYIPNRWGFSVTSIEDLKAATQEHPFLDAYWQSKIADFSKIDVPAYVCASWTDHGMHTRGTLEGFKRISSKRKWLEIHGRKKWAYYFEPKSVARQQQFFEHVLKGKKNKVATWPKVWLEVRERFFVGEMKAENEWPIKRTKYTALYLDGAGGTLKRRPLAKKSVVRYDSERRGRGVGRAEFDHTFDKATELVGHMKLKLWAEADGGDDMDIFVAIQKLDAGGKVVPFAFWAHFDDGPVALGWLRASHRELDPKKSTPYQPVLTHRREMKIKKGEIVPLEIEIWPSGTVFEKGEKLRVVVQGSDIYDYPKPTSADRHEDRVNRGHHLIHTGGEYDSHLLIPVVPK